MKTANELHDLYIYLLTNTNSQDEYQQEVIRTRNIVGCSIKRQRSSPEQAFCDYVKDFIYNGNTGFDILKKKFNIKTDNATVDFWVNKTGLNSVILQSKVNASSRLAGIKIKNGFILQANRLNKILEA